ncbi:GNAT family N-acetyltransferase [Halobacillus sp. KCTC 3957]|uniref:GNAT family N-acetyltransferase n=2 Tax=Halobacillus yeomjeoni TaxID=311194 RepID=A0A931HTR4_9BACI|nr:GNAT family N-acetyltransferase [Halobacillus yeomjeoni]
MGHLGYPTTVEEMEHRFKNISMTSTYHTQVAEVGGRVVGMVLGLPYNRNNPYVRIVAFVVDVDYRNQGIGSGLLQAAEEWARSREANMLVLNSGNRTERKDAHLYYSNRGFEGKATGFYKKLT